MSLPPEGIVKRYYHIAATVAIIEEFYEIVLFGGKTSRLGVVMNKIRIIRFGKCDINEEKCNSASEAKLTNKRGNFLKI